MPVNKFTIFLAIVHVMKLVFISVAYYFLVFYPIELIPNVKSRDRNDALNIWIQTVCVSPNPNVHLTDKEITNVLDLPDGTLLHPNLYKLGKCRAAVAKLDVDDSACFCFDTSVWLTVAAGVAAFCIAKAAFEIGQFSMLAYYRVDAETDFSSVAKDSLAAIFIFVVVVTSAINWSAKFRYSPPNSVYPVAYYAEPPAWSLVGLMCALYCLVCAIQLGVACLKRELWEFRSARQVDGGVAETRKIPSSICGNGDKADEYNDGRTSGENSNFVYASFKEHAYEKSPKMNFESEEKIGDGFEFGSISSRTFQCSSVNYSLFDGLYEREAEIPTVPLPSPLQKQQRTKSECDVSSEIGKKIRRDLSISI